MTFEQFLMFVKHMSVEQFRELSFESKMNIEYEYDLTYGI